MVYSQELADRATAWLALPLNDKRSGPGLTELGSLWAATQGLPPVECRQCQYSDRARAVAAYPREFLQFSTSSAAMSDTQTSSYQLAPAYANQSFVHEDYNGALTADNLTDEGAEFFISKGFGHAFLKRVGNVVEAVGEGIEHLGEKIEGEDAELTEREQELQAEVDEVNQKLADQTTSYNKAYGQLQAELTSSVNALASEKDAHQVTSSQLSEVQKQLATAQAILAALPPAQLQKATDKANGKPTAPDAPADGSSDGPAMTASSTTPATASDSATGTSSDAPATV